MRRASAAFIALCALLCVTAPAHAYRTAADLPEFAGTERVRWEADRVVSRMHDEGAPGVSIVDAERALVEGFSVWREPMCSAFDPAYGGISSREIAPDDGLNTVQWLGAGWASRGFPADAAGTTDLSYVRGADGVWRIAEADVYLNAEAFMWRASGGDPSSGYRDIRAVVAHESGHVLGLLHPCEVGGRDGAPGCSADAGFAATTMYPLYTGPSQAMLSDDDVAGVCFLYPVPSCADTACPSGMVCTSAGCAEQCGVVVCAVGEVCRSGACGPPGCIGPGCEGPCETSADCPMAEQCLAHRCLPRGRPLGDPCTATEECMSGLCGSDGHCTVACSDGTCPGGYSCATGMPGSDECAADLGVFGEPCSFASDCASGLCLEGAEPEPICTRACAAEPPECPEAYVCGVVEGTELCRPPPQESGCSVSRRSPDATRDGVLAAVVLALAVARARRRQVRRR